MLGSRQSARRVLISGQCISKHAANVRFQATSSGAESASSTCGLMWLRKRPFHTGLTDVVDVAQPRRSGSAVASHFDVPIVNQVCDKIRLSSRRRPNSISIRTYGRHSSRLALRTLALRNPDLAELVGDASRQAFVATVDLCLAEHVDALVIAGDLYDGDQTSMKTVRFLGSQMARLHQAGISVFKVRGNHDA